MYYQEVEKSGNDRIAFAIFLASAAHLLLVLGLTFDAHETRNYTRQIEVTLTTQLNNVAPDEAKFIAQTDQLGAGEEAPWDQAQKQKPAPIVAGSSQEFPPAPPEESIQHSDAIKALATTSAARRKIQQQEAAPTPDNPLIPGTHPEVDRLEQQLADLEATLEDQSQAYADRPRVRRLSAMSAKRSVDAAYLHDWRQRLEAVGNKYYPEASLRYGIYGELRLLVVIRQDGSLEDIRILSSSGYAVLDEAAMKIVRLAAPFAPFPAELRETTDKLEIIRTWQFQENSLSSG
ncbi:MAG: energy transducer TonB [Halioglobus sp.]